MMFREIWKELTMSATAPTAVNPIAFRQDEGEALWFLGVLATIKASRETTDGQVAVIEHLASQGAGSPLHVHHNEDEWFYVTEGELTFWVGGQLTDAPAGSFVYGPRGIPHTFTVTSPEARFLLVTEPAGFEGFMRALSEPAQSLTLPPATTPPTRPRANDGHRDRVRHRDPRPARHPHLKSAPSTRSALNPTTRGRCVIVAVQRRIQWCAARPRRLFTRSVHRRIRVEEAVRLDPELRRLGRV
jgi:quercetin dioxygenase-like cupin family protein